MTTNNKLLDDEPQTEDASTSGNPFGNNFDIEDLRRKALSMSKEEERANSAWFQIKQNETRRAEVLCLEGVPCPEYVQKTFKNQVQKKIVNGVQVDMMCYKYTVLDRSNGNPNPKPQAFEVGKNSHKLIKAELEKGNWILDITRTGTGTDTLYTPVAVQ
jgi:hypothetical protein